MFERPLTDHFLKAYPPLFIQNMMDNNKHRIRTHFPEILCHKNGTKFAFVVHRFLNLWQSWHCLFAALLLLLNLYLGSSHMLQKEIYDPKPRQAALTVSHLWICVWKCQKRCRAGLGRMRSRGHKLEAQQPTQHRPDLWSRGKGQM